MELQLHYINYTTPQLQLHHTTLHYNYNYSCTTPHYIQQLWVRRPTRWPLQPLQPLQKTQLQPPFGPSVDSLCHLWFTTTNLSCRFPIFETSATALCGTTGNNIVYYIIIIIIIYIYIHSLCEICKLETRPIHCIWVWEHPRLPLLRPGTQWVECQASAHLVSISSAEEQDFVGLLSLLQEMDTKWRWHGCEMMNGDEMETNGASALGLTIVRVVGFTLSWIQPDFWSNGTNMKMHQVFIWLH